MVVAIVALPVFSLRLGLDDAGTDPAAAIFIDAFVVRTALVPALMHLCGRANWWLPTRLERRLPHLAVDLE